MSFLKSIPFLLILVTCVWCGCLEDISQLIPQEQVQHPQEHIQQPQTLYSAEMQNLITFLKSDQTSNIEYYDDPRRGIEYYVCAGFARSLAENATAKGIPMGGISLRNTPTVGPATEYYHAMNYVIVDNQFLIIEPQFDTIFTLEEIKTYKKGAYRYITIFQNAQMITNYGKHKETIDIDLYSNYNESEIIEKYPPI